MKKKSGNAVAPTNTVTPARVRLFQPSQRPRFRNGDWIETNWGRCRVIGRLGQRHADLLESILFVAERRRDTDDGGIELLVDPARIRKCLSDKRHSLQRIKQWIGELMTAVVCIEPSTNNLPAIEGHLIDHREDSPMTRPDPLTGGKRHLWRIRLGKPMAILIEQDINLYHDPAPIARLQYGISQAVARHILSHKTEPPGGWHLETVITAVTGSITKKAMRDARYRIRLDADGLAAIGLILDEDERIKRRTKAR